MADNATIVIGRLDTKELEEAIDNLVMTIDDGMQDATAAFDDGITKMEGYLTRLNTTAKTTIADIRDSFKALGTTYDDFAKAMQAAAAAAGGKSGKGGSGGGKVTNKYTANSEYGALLGELEAAKKDAEEMRRDLAEFSPALERANRKIEELTRRIKEAKSNPITLDDVMSMREDSVTAITAKIKALKNIKIGNATEQATVTAEFQRLNKVQKEMLGNNALLTASNNGLARSFGYIRNRLVYALTLGAATSFAKQIYEVRSQYELLERSLGVLVGSFETGSRMFQELNDMALKSPFTLMELAGAAKQLTAYNFAANEVVNTTRRLADLSAALGVPMERLTYNLGQIRAQTVLTARDARDFANAGLPIVKSLADYYTVLEGRIVSTGDVYQRMSKKMVSYEDVIAVLNKMTDEGGRFFDFQAKQAQTLKVQLANLTLAWNNMLNEMGRVHQGLLTLPVSGLKAVFKNWKDISRLLSEMIIAFGTYRAIMMAMDAIMGKNNATIEKQILANKRKIAIDLERKALTQQLTAAEMKTLATRNMVTAADYEQMLAGRALTKQQALMMLAFKRKNSELANALVSMKLLTQAEATNITTGKALGLVFKNIGLSIKNMAASLAAFAASNWVFIALAAIYELGHAWHTMAQNIKELNHSIADSAKESFESIDEYLKNYTDTLKRLYRVTNDTNGKVTAQGQPSNLSNIPEEEATKAWEAMREEIQKSAMASNNFLAKLEDIEDVNDRLRKGFDYLQRLHDLNGALQEIDEKAIKVSKTVLLGLFGEGLKDDVKDFLKSAEEIRLAYGDIENAADKVRLAQENGMNIGIGDTFHALAEFQKETSKVASSIYDEAERRGWDVDMQREFFERTMDQVRKTQDLGVKEYRATRIAAEEEYYRYAKQKLEEDIEYATGARKTELSARLAHLKKEFNTQKALSETFFTWLSETQSSETQRRLGTLTAEELKHGEWLTGENAKWATEMAQKFSTEYGVSFDRLRSLVGQANTWKIYVPVFFQYAQGLSDIARDFEERTGEQATAEVKTAKTVSEIVDNARKEEKRLTEEVQRLKNAGAEKETSILHQRYVEANKELQIQKKIRKAYNDTDEEKDDKKDPFGDALAKEVQLIGEVQKRYKEYRKMGVDANTALAKSADEYQKSIENVNKELQKYGLQTLSPVDLANMTPQDLRDFYQEQIEGATKTTKGTEALEKAIAELNVEITKIDYTRITEGLNNELGKLKDEYELGVELDATPELSNVFMDAMGLDKDAMNALPRDFEGVMARMQDIIDEKIGAGRFDLTKNLNKAAFDAWLEANQQGMPKVDELAESLNAFREYANKVREDETKKQVEEWNKLLEKYAEYEYKVTQIQAEAERERNVARKKGASQAIMEAIDRREAQQLAQLQFDEFQKTPAWLTATGDLADLTDRALGMLIDDLEEYKKKAKNLDPKQIKTLNNALRKLRNEQRKDNPFLAIAVAMDEAKGRFEDYQIKIDEVSKVIDDYERKVYKGIDVTEKETEAYKKALEALKKLREEQAEASTVPTKTIVESIRGMQQWVTQASGMFAEMFTALGNTRFAETIQNINNIMDKAGTGAAIGAQVAGGKGAIIGAIAGGLMGAITVFSDAITGNKGITDAIEASERAVKRLTISMKNLEDAADDAYGTMTAGANMTIIANKKLQLIEIERQLQLEKSRKKKKRDEDRIMELEEQINDLRLEIKNGAQDIVNDLLGISSAGDAIESLVEVMIDAFRNGEDAMDAFGKKWDEMIDNMMMKLIVSTFMQETWDDIMNTLNQKREEFMQKAAKEQATAQARNEAAESMTDDELAKMIADELGYKTIKGDRNELKKQLQRGGVQDRSLKGGTTYYIEAWQQVTDEEIEAYRQMLQHTVANTADATDKASDAYFKWAIDFMKGPGREKMMERADMLEEALGDMFTSDNNQLSALQQGIQGITEDTAGALEAYMNGVSQQVYLHSDLLTQIRDTVVNMDFDIHLATQSQMLLQLQSSYTVQQSIQGILEGVLNPNGQAFNVALVN